MADALKENSTCNACHALVQQADFLAERLTVLLLLAPKHVWNSIQNGSVLVSAPLAPSLERMLKYANFNSDISRVSLIMLILFTKGNSSVIDHTMCMPKNT